MSYYTYGMWVRVVEGDPDDLAACQFAFAAHHTKYANYVQELRKTPVVPYLHGFTMPTREKDAETNACLKQVLLRPHHCSGRNKCRSIEFTSAFSEPTTIRGNNRGATTELCFSMCCKRYLAGQKTLAERADHKLCISRMWPVLQDVVGLRQWWLPGAVCGGCVHEFFIPLLCGQVAHPTDSSLQGVWFRPIAKKLRANACDSIRTRKLMHEWRWGGGQGVTTKPCIRLQMPIQVSWLILCFAGYVAQENGAIMGIASNMADLERLRRFLSPAKDFVYTSPGFHDMQLTAAEFYAWRHVEVAQRLEYMAEARGLPRPGQLHPEAEGDEYEGAQGGSQRHGSSV